MQIDYLGRRDFLKYGLISSLFFLAGCSTSEKKLALRGVNNSFPNELISSLSSDWEFFPIEDIGSEKFPYNSSLKEKTDLLVLNDGWISELQFDLIREIQATNIREKLSNQANSFLKGLGKDYENKILPLAVSPWVILFRNEDSLALKNKNSWEVIFSDSLLNKIVFPSSPRLLISIAKKIGFSNELSKIKNQSKLFDDRNALNWVVSGRANAAILPLSNCVDNLFEDPRLSVLLPKEGSPLNWTVLASPTQSLAAFPSDWFDIFWGPVYSKRLRRKGFFPPTDFLELRRQNIKVPKKYQSIFFPEKSTWNECWSLPILSAKEKKDLALIWNET